MKDQKILIVGGLSGIGFAVAQQAAAAGARVTVAGRRAAPAGLPATITAMHVDIANDASVAALFEGVGAFDHLVITAGPVIGSAKLAELDIADAMAAFNIKFFGQMRVAQRALDTINRAGSITLTSGLLARKAAPGALVKASMNAATEIMAKTLAKELAPLRVNVVSPGMVETGMWGDMSEADRKAMAARVGANLPVGRVGQGGDLAQAYLMLMQNGFMTGSVIDVDGGGLL